ncbi:hypothetical protein [Rubellimicrobium arenae]|nr:hypothetical protein [Rubellimicrobium arenae]
MTKSGTSAPTQARRLVVDASRLVGIESVGADGGPTPVAVGVKPPPPPVR